MKKKNQDAAIIAGSGLVIVAYAAIVRQRYKKHKEALAEIEANKQKNLKAIHIAAGVVHEKIVSGDYDELGPAQIMDDFEFYTIAFRSEED